MGQSLCYKLVTSLLVLHKSHDRLCNTCSVCVQQEKQHTQEELCVERWEVEHYSPIKAHTLWRLKYMGEAKGQKK